MIEKGRKFSILTYSAVEKSYHQVIVGKAHWMGVVLPSVSYGAEVIDLREANLRVLQKVENEAMGKILRAPGYAPIVAIRGEIGMGTMKSRVVRGRHQYTRSKMQGENELVKWVIEEMQVGRSQRGRRTEKNMEWEDVQDR